jgi:hypothetical protein
MKKPYHGTCLVSGRHPADSLEAKECPLFRAQARKDRAVAAATARWGAHKHTDGRSTAQGQGERS